MEDALTADPVRDRLRALACNPALPAETLLLLAGDERVGPRHVTARREWTDEAFDALATHPDPAVREALAQSPGATGEQRARLAGDLNIDVLHALLEGPHTRWAGPLPHWVHRRLAEHPERLVRDMLTFLPGTPPDVLNRLTRDPYPRIAEAARELLERKPFQEPTMGRDQAVAYASGDSPWNRAQAAADPELPAPWVRRLAADPSPRVRLAVSVRPELDEDERAAIDCPIPEDVPVPGWVVAAGPSELRRCAHSRHPLLRRGAAGHPDLPDDLIALLAGDGDPLVRSALCSHQAGAPGELVLRTYLETGDEELLAHPVFPRAGLATHPSGRPGPAVHADPSSGWAGPAGYAGYPSGRARALARLDPEAPAALIDRLSRDPDPYVRAFLADDPRLSAARVVELLADPEIHGRAAANPNLPHAQILRILAEANL
ncbi:hypothetical protein GCM10010112_21800 [Actinoplanes lobatus]|uniref:Leucine rich repeat variant n=1 Tax=Actinoplanes lobatus TaxID=113568 RepID=A0A7W7HPS6_9ACTN|nr:hypothetical protein [Actinoplanes lobatus]MBB4754434.1 hypothetical protein [Actinoplanes lobatus]GGN63000.1 hypothetical protein GCM10010112_21800 [Actinoplanes lobatus]GIE40486.1 hypothetical protein Alo02nite_33840 [Actinoplanes lobatus]